MTNQLMPNATVQLSGNAGSADIHETNLGRRLRQQQQLLDWGAATKTPATTTTTTTTATRKQQRRRNSATGMSTPPSQSDLTVTSKRSATTATTTGTTEDDTWSFPPQQQQEQQQKQKQLSGLGRQLQAVSTRTRNMEATAATARNTQSRRRKACSRPHSPKTLMEGGSPNNGARHASNNGSHSPTTVSLRTWTTTTTTSNTPPPKQSFTTKPTTSGASTTAIGTTTSTNATTTITPVSSSNGDADSKATPSQSDTITVDNRSLSPRRNKPKKKRRGSVGVQDASSTASSVRSLSPRRRPSQQTATERRSSMTGGSIATTSAASTHSKASRKRSSRRSASSLGKSSHHSRDSNSTTSKSPTRSPPSAAARRRRKAALRTCSPLPQVQTLAASSNTSQQQQQEEKQEQQQQGGEEDVYMQLLNDESEESRVFQDFWRAKTPTNTTKKIMHWMSSDEEEVSSGDENEDSQPPLDVVHEFFVRDPFNEQQQQQQQEQEQKINLTTSTSAASASQSEDDDDDDDAMNENEMERCLERFPSHMFSGDMLQTFLKDNGHDKEMAQTLATAFDAFLKQQQQQKELKKHMKSRQAVKQQQEVAHRKLIQEITSPRPIPPPRQQQQQQQQVTYHVPQQQQQQHSISPARSPQKQWQHQQLSPPRQPNSPIRHLSPHRLTMEQQSRGQQQQQQPQMRRKGPQPLLRKAPCYQSIPVMRKSFYDQRTFDDSSNRHHQQQPMHDSAFPLTVTRKSSFEHHHRTQQAMRRQSAGGNYSFDRSSSGGPQHMTRRLSGGGPQPMSRRPSAGGNYSMNRRPSAGGKYPMTRRPSAGGNYSAVRRPSANGNHFPATRRASAGGNSASGGMTKMERRLSANMYNSDINNNSSDDLSRGGDSFVPQNDWEDGTFVSYSMQQPLGNDSDHSHSLKRNTPTNMTINTNSRPPRDVRINGGGFPKQSSLRNLTSDLQSLASTTSAAGGACIARLPPELLARMSIQATSNSANKLRSAEPLNKDSVLTFDDGSVLTHSTLQERSVREKLNALSSDERTVVLALQKKWELTQEGKAHPLTIDWYIRFASCSVSFQAAWKLMKKFDTRYLNLNIGNMENNLLEMIVFEVTGLKCIKGNEVMYMKPSRFSPKEKPVSGLLDTLAYIMQCMCERETSEGGICLIANMADWKMSNFTLQYWHKLMMMLQGRKVPIRVESFLILDPPSWFGSIWSITKPMLTEAFRRVVQIVTVHDLKKHLQGGFQNYLPADIHIGKGDSNRIVRNFIEYRKRVESARILNSSTN